MSLQVTGRTVVRRWKMIDAIYVISVDSDCLVVPKSIHGIPRRPGTVKQNQRGVPIMWGMVTCLTPQLNTDCTKSVGFIFTGVGRST